MAAEVRIGTSGWHYNGWWGPFFPPDLKKKDALVYYASQFDCYFDNDVKSAAPHDARRLIELVRGKRALARAA